jgi:hypothetical protein
MSYLPNDWPLPDLSDVSALEVSGVDDMIERGTREFSALKNLYRKFRKASIYSTPYNSTFVSDIYRRKGHKYVMTLEIGSYIRNLSPVVRFTQVRIDDFRKSRKVDLLVKWRY